MELRAEEISEIIKKQINEYGKEVEVSETGTIISIGDGIARIHGLAGAMAGELLEAYTSAIAAQYVMDTLDKVAAIGAQPAIDLRASKGLKPESISVVREHIMSMVRAGNESKLQVLERLAEKRKMVEVIMQVNKTLQAEVIGQGLAGNANLAINIKRQQTK